MLRTYKQLLMSVELIQLPRNRELKLSVARKHIQTDTLKSNISVLHFDIRFLPLTQYFK